MVDYLSGKVKGVGKWVLVGAGYLGFTGRAMAQTRPFAGNEVVNGVPTIMGLEAVFNNIVVVVIGLAGLAVFIMLIAGGIGYIFSGGEAEAVAKARKTITYALLGLVLLVGAYLILKLVQVITGVNVTVFNLYRG